MQPPAVVLLALTTTVCWTWA